jgi:uncharacterized protein (TIGR02246 family)
MRSLITAWCVIVAGSVAGAQVPSATAADEAAVREIVRRYTAARGLSDPKSIEALFIADADQYPSAGEWRRGVAQLVKGMLETSKRNPGIRAIDVQAVRFITPDVAIADGNYRAGQNAQPLWTTIVVRRDAQGWRIAAIRNSAPR